MNFDGKKWRAAVRAAFDDGTANRYGSGPWLPTGWYELSWNHWKKGGMTLEITEAKENSYTAASGPTHGSGPLSITETVITETAHFIAEVTAEDLWRGPAIDAPVGSSIWQHGSRCAFGPGLYHCEGYIALRGSLTLTYKVVLNVTTEEGDFSSTVTTDTTTTDPTSIVMEYSTLPADLNGLETFCRITVGQFLPPVTAFIFNPTIFFDQPSDPDGNISHPELGPEYVRAEVYWTDIALKVLAEGSWSDSMDLLGDSISVPQGPNEDGIDNGGYQSQTWVRSGNLSLITGT